MDEFDRVLGSDGDDEIVTLFSEEVPVHTLESIPDSGSWALPLLEKTNDDGNTYVWQIMFDGEYLITKSGRIDGVKTPHLRLIEPKGGKSFQKQAKQDLSKKHQNKVDQGYSTGDEDEEYEIFKQPMLASILKNFKQIKRYPVAVQFKYNGERAIVRKESEFEHNVAIRSRTMKVISNLNHLREDMNVFFRYLPPGTMLDGELYIHGMNRNKIRSAIGAHSGKSKKVSPNNKYVQYVIFDIIDKKKVFEDRIDILKNAYENYLENNEKSNFVITSTFMAFDQDSMTCFYDMAIDMGYEGTIVRYFGGECDGNKHEILTEDPISSEMVESTTCDLVIKDEPFERSYYRHGRSVGMFKVKPFFEEEGEIIDIENEEGGDRSLAKLVLMNPDGVVFRMRPAGTIKKRQEILKNKEKYIGMHYEYKYQEKFESGRPNILGPIGFK